MPGYLFTYENLLKSYVSECVTGRNGEIFINHASPNIDGALGILHYSSELMEHDRLLVAGKHAYFMSKGIPYYFFLAPRKQTVYPEWLPFYSDWIPHPTWYHKEVKTFQKANVNFYPLLDLLLKHKDQERFYDVAYDTSHWNGNAVALAYDYIANILAKDNPIFKPVRYNEYYILDDTKVSYSVYRNEISKFIRLKHTEDFSCSVPPDQYLSFSGFNAYCVNHTKSGGVLWFYSDSYFGNTHGSLAVTPFVHNVKHYLHRGYGLADASKPFTKIADATLAFLKPDAVIEENVEMNRSPRLTTADPLLRLLGDYWMKTHGIFLDRHTYLTAFSLSNAEFSGNELTVQSGSRLTLKETATADDLGRVVVMGKIDPPADSALRIHYQVEGGPEQILDFGLHKAAPAFHQTVHVKPYSKVRLSLEFLTPGKYTLGRIKETEDLNEKIGQARPTRIPPKKP